MFLAYWKPKAIAFTVFVASGSKNHGIYNVFWPEPSKDTGIYAVFSMLQDVVSICEKDKTIVFYDVFVTRAQQKSIQKVAQKRQHQLPKATYNFSIFFPGPRPPNTSKHKQPEGFSFGGVLSAVCGADGADRGGKPGWCSWLWQLALIYVCNFWGLKRLKGLESFKGFQCCQVALSKGYIDPKWTQFAGLTALAEAGTQAGCWWLWQLALITCATFEVLRVLKVFKGVQGCHVALSEGYTDPK